MNVFFTYLRRIKIKIDKHSLGIKLIILCDIKTKFIMIYEITHDNILKFE